MIKDVIIHYGNVVLKPNRGLSLCMDMVILLQFKDSFMIVLGETLSVENGITGRFAVLHQAREARQVIEKHHPTCILTLGGDCLVDLAPIAYLNALYEGKLGVLWVDSHPDVMTPKDYPNAHAHVLGALLGRGDPDLIGEVEKPLVPSRVMFAGLDTWSPVEDAVIQGLGMQGRLLWPRRRRRCWTGSSARELSTSQSISIPTSLIHRCAGHLLSISRACRPTLFLACHGTPRA